MPDTTPARARGGSARGATSNRPAARPARGESETARQRARRDAHRGDRPRRAGDTRSPGTQADPTLDSLQLFFRQASGYPLLTAAEEVELAKRIERGDVAAKDRMINSNLRLVISRARRFQGHGLSLGDLIQEGMLGLIRATEKFDWRRGYKFSTYATLWIQQAIQRGIANSGSTIRIPVHIGQRERKVQRAERELAARLARDPTDAEVAAETELAESEVRELRELARNLASLDQPVGEDGETSLGNLLASERAQPDVEVDDALGDERVREVVEGLPADERAVVKLRFGLDGEVRSVREVSAQLGISPDRARRLESRGLRRLAESGELDELRTAA